MSHWHEKQTTTPFDCHAVPGLAFQDGALLKDWYLMTIGEKEVPSYEAKLPMILFPSGHEGVLRVEPNGGWSVHVYTSLWISVFRDRDQAYHQLQEHVSPDGVIVRKVNQDQVVITYKNLIQYTFTYDNQARVLSNVEINSFPAGKDIPESKALAAYLPTERVATEAVAMSDLPVLWQSQIEDYAKKMRSSWERYPKDYAVRFIGELAGYTIKVNPQHRLFEAVPVFVDQDNAQAVSFGHDGIVREPCSITDVNYVAFDLEIPTTASETQD